MGSCESKDAAKKWTAADIPDQAGRVVVVTGANSGIGAETVRHAAAKGADVILCARDQAKGEAAAADIAKKLPSEPAPGKISVEVLDLCSFDSVKAFAKRAENKLGPFAKGVDVLVLNAGVMAIKDHTTTKDGFETQFQTNHLASFLLVGSLLPVLKQSTKNPTVVPVASIRATDGQLRAGSDMEGWFKGTAPKYSPEPNYNASKQANLLFGTQLHKRHGSWLRVMPCHPGVSATNLFRHGWYGAFSAMFQSAEAGSLLECRAAFDSSLPPFTYVGTSASYKTGAWKGSPQPEEPAPHAVDPETAAKLWTASEAAVGLEW